MGAPSRNYIPTPLMVDAAGRPMVRPAFVFQARPPMQRPMAPMSTQSESSNAGSSYSALPIARPFPEISRPFEDDTFSIKPRLTPPMIRPQYIPNGSFAPYCHVQQRPSLLTNSNHNMGVYQPAPHVEMKHPSSPGKRRYV